VTIEKLLKNAKRITRCHNKQEADMLEELLSIFDHEARTVEASREQIIRLRGAGVGFGEWVQRREA